MTPAQIVLVQESFRKVISIREQAAALFYGRLFELDPSIKTMFRADLAAQGQKLMAALGAVVGSLNRPDELMGNICGLAQRHVAYGVVDRHYRTVGEALMWTLERGLGNDFTPDVQAAWAKAYSHLATAMIAATRAIPSNDNDRSLTAEIV